MQNKKALDVIEKKLACDTIIAKECIAKADVPGFEVYLITTKSGIKGVFKSRCQLHNLAEVAAYRASKELNLSLVPPTVLRKIDSEEGSLQLYIQPTNRNISFDQLSSFASSNLIIFQYIFGKIDWIKQDLSNIIIPMGSERFVLAIDNATIGLIQKIQYGKAPCWKSDIPYEGQSQENFSFENFRLTSEHIDKENFFKKIDLSPESLIWIYKFGCFNNFVWFQVDSSVFELNYTNVFFKLLIPKYRKLNEKLLEKIWDIDDYYKKNIPYFKELFSQVLDRKNFILNEIYKKGK